MERGLLMPLHWTDFIGPALGWIALLITVVLIFIYGDKIHQHQQELDPVERGLNFIAFAILLHALLGRRSCQNQHK